MARLSRLLLLAAVGVACSDSTQPTMTTPPSEDDGSYVLEETETIGPAGGTVAANDFSLVIPAGAFDGNHTLVLYAASGDQPLGETQVTRTFRLEGLPEEYAQPLSVSIKYEGTLTDESFVGSGALVFDPFTVDSATAYRLLPTVDSSGYLVSDLPASQGAALAHSDDAHRVAGSAHGPVGNVTDILGVTGHRTRETEHFRIRYPEFSIDHPLVAADIDYLAASLEHGYNTVVDDLHLGYPRDLWPFEVLVRDLGPSGTVSLSLSRPGRFEVNQAMLSSDEHTKLREEIGRRLLLLAFFDSQGHYDGSDAAKEVMESDEAWLVWAVLEWAQERFTDDAGYVSPDGFQLREMAPFHGLRPVADPDYFVTAVSHGGGMSAVIKYLVEQPVFGESGVQNTFARMRLTDDKATAALLNSVSTPAGEWWPDFFTAYVAGEIYGVSPAVFTASENLAGVWDIDDPQDIQREFVVSYPDLSAKLFRVNLDYTGIREWANMVIEASSEVTGAPLTVIVFGRKGGPLEYFGQASDADEFALQIDGLGGLIDDGWRELLVVVVNSHFDDSPPSPYTGTSDIALTMRIAALAEFTTPFSIQEEDAGCITATAPESSGEMTMVLDAAAQTVNLVFEGSGSGDRTDVGCIPEEFDLDWSLGYSGEFSGDFTLQGPDVAIFFVGGWADWHITRTYRNCTRFGDSSDCPPDVDLQRPEPMTFSGTVNLTTGETTGTIDLPGRTRASGSWGN